MMFGRQRNESIKEFLKHLSIYICIVCICIFIYIFTITSISLSISNCIDQSIHPSVLNIYMRTYLYSLPLPSQGSVTQ